MLTHRILTSLVLFALLYVVFFVVSSYVFTQLTVVFFFIALYELLRMYKISRLNLIGTAGVFFLLCYYTIFKFQYPVSQLIQILAVIVWCFIVPLIIVIRPAHIVQPLVIIIALLIFLLACYSIVLLRNILGVWQLISIMAIAWIADSGAYFVGRKFGRHKLAPQISPAKSIEGAVAGIVFVLIYLTLLKYFNLVDYLSNYLAVVKFGVVLVIVSIIGDLFESWLKRVAGIKDSGKILPGHGGVFDRVDSLIAVVSLAYAMIRGTI
jgi:phosphatidate cytidylyltransferase